MNWELAASIAEVVSAVAVVLSLLYLAKQIQQNSRHLENQAENDVYTRVNQAYDPIYAENNGEIMWKGLHRSEELSESEAFVFDLLMDRQMTAVVQSAHQAELGMLGQDVIAHFAGHYQRIYMDSPGGRNWIEKHEEVMRKAIEQFGLK